jgi:hypothetical protein
MIQTGLGRPLMAETQVALKEWQYVESTMR